MGKVITTIKQGASSSFNNDFIFKTRRWYLIKKNFSREKYLYIMSFIGFIWIFIFHYIPMYGIITAFKRYTVAQGIWGSEWVGFRYFEMFIRNPYFFRLIKNTLVLGFLSLLWGFWPPILLALMFNEVQNKAFKKAIQTITYFPNFIATVIIVGMLMEFSSPNGLFNNILARFRLGPIHPFMNSKWFRPMYISSGIWQSAGRGSIIYLATLAGINLELYEHAVVEGAGRWKQMRYITLPSLMPTIIILLILNSSNIVRVGFEKVFLMYNPGIYSTADVIATFVYRVGINEGMISYGTAVGLMNQLAALIFLVATNMIARRVSEYSLW